MVGGIITDLIVVISMVFAFVFASFTLGFFFSQTVRLLLGGLWLCYTALLVDSRCY